MKGWMVALCLAVATSTSAQVVSSDGARVPPLTSVTDAVGRVYAFAPDTAGCRPVVINGDDSNAGCGSELLIWQGRLYVRGVTDVWWQYTGLGWQTVGLVDPSTVPSSPIPPVRPPVPDPVASAVTLAWTIPGLTMAAVLDGRFDLYVYDVPVEYLGFDCRGSGPDQGGPDLVCRSTLPIRIVFVPATQAPSALTIEPSEHDDRPR